MIHPQPPSFTPRESEVIRHLCGGLRNKDIAGLMSVTEGTVKVYLSHIFEKTGVVSRLDLILKFGCRVTPTTTGELTTGEVAAIEGIYGAHPDVQALIRDIRAKQRRLDQYAVAEVTQ